MWVGVKMGGELGRRCSESLEPGRPLGTPGFWMGPLLEVFSAGNGQLECRPIVIGPHKPQRKAPFRGGVTAICPPELDPATHVPTYRGGTRRLCRRKLLLISKMFVVQPVGLHHL